MLNYKDEYYDDFDGADTDKIMAELIEFINNKGEGSIAEYILDFCETYNYRIEEIAYLVAENKTFKNILKQDCIHHGIFKTEKTVVDEW
jgi:hypothetical protein